MQTGRAPFTIRHATVRYEIHIIRHRSIYSQVTIPAMQVQLDDARGAEGQLSRKHGLIGHNSQLNQYQSVQQRL